MATRTFKNGIFLYWRFWKRVYLHFFMLQLNAELFCVRFINLKQGLRLLVLVCKKNRNKLKELNRLVLQYHCYRPHFYCSWPFNLVFFGNSLSQCVTLQNSLCVNEPVPFTGDKARPVARFLFSSDRRFVIKTITGEDIAEMHGILPKYHQVLYRYRKRFS